VRKIKQHEGREIRGLKLKAYPTAEQEMALLDVQRRLRRLWNWLVARAADTRAANEAWAVKNGAGPRPERPANDAGADAWAAYKGSMRAWYADVRRVLEPHRKDSAFRYRNVRDYCQQFGVKHDYQLYPHLFDDDPPASALLQALFKAYDQALAGTQRGMAPPRRKKRDEDMLLQSGTGKLFRVGAFGSRPSCRNGRKDWLDAQIQIPGVGRIACRLGSDRGLQSSEYWVEGASLRREGDGWYAAIRQHVIVPPKPKGVGACGIDVGLVSMFAVVGDDGATLLADNTRRGSHRGHLRTPGGYVEWIAERQAAGLPVSRMHCRAARHVREYVRRELFPFTDRYEFIVVEDLPPNIGQRGLPHLSFMRTVRTMLIQRYGSERVIDVDPTDTSRTCSMCGEMQPRSWSDIPGRVGRCASCGHEENSDLNAARNVLHRLVESEAAE
jgi:hypothetical protein